MRGALRICWLSILNLGKVTDNTKEKNKTNVGQRTKTTGVKWSSHIWREFLKEYTE